ncbi:hypothetical protein ABZ896_41740 [Streptomyces sp. NPDC047072]
MFDLRTEAEMRLYSDAKAKELASKRKRDDDVEEQTVAEAKTAVEPEQAA